MKKINNLNFKNMLEIKNTKDMEKVGSFNAIIYGMGGVGKTTMASTFPKPIIFDFENGTKFFKSRGIEVDTIQMTKWFTDEDKKQVAEIIKNYETIIIDPIGTATQILVDDTEAIKGSKNRQADGNLTIAGWGEVKKQVRSFIQWLILSKKNVILIAHEVEAKDENTGSFIKRPNVPTGLKDELPNMVDVVAYLVNGVAKNKEGKEIMSRWLDMRTGMPYFAKDRTEKLSGKAISPDWKSISKFLNK